MGNIVTNAALNVVKNPNSANPPQPTIDQLLARIAELEAKQAAKGQIHFKVGEKGGVSVYGLNSRFPVTMYFEQWLRLFAHEAELKAFIDANKHLLKSKASS
jgi:hypothetical protein